MKNLNDKISISCCKHINIDFTEEQFEILNKMDIEEFSHKSFIFKSSNSVDVYNKINGFTNEKLKEIKNILDDIRHETSKMRKLIYYNKQTYKFGRTCDYEDRFNKYDEKRFINIMFILAESNNINFIKFLESFFAKLYQNQDPEQCENDDTDSKGKVKKDVPLQYLCFIKFDN